MHVVQPEELVRINNTQARLLHLPANIQITECANNELKYIGAGTGRVLKPGGNNVPKSYWEWSQKNATVKSYLKMGWVTVGGDVAAKEGPPAPTTLMKYNETAAIAMVAGEDDQELLALWKSVEKRPRVIEAFEAKDKPKTTAKKRLFGKKE